MNPPQNATAARVATSRAFAPYDPRGAGGRLAAGVIVGVVVALAIASLPRAAVCLVAGWDAGSFTTLALSWWIIAKADASETRRRAAAQDPGRNAVWVLVLISCTFSLFAATVVLRQARSLSPDASHVFVALCLIAVTSAWALTHTTYALRYAHLYYRDGHRDCESGAGGLEFPGKEPPTDDDFAYFAFTIGMCFQVSDVVVTTSRMRRTVLAHSILSFAYNTVILALALNLVFGLAS